MEGDCFSDWVVKDSNFGFATSVCLSVSTLPFLFPNSELLMEFIGKEQKVTPSEEPLRNRSPRSPSPEGVTSASVTVGPESRAFLVNSPDKTQAWVDIWMEPCDRY